MRTPRFIWAKACPFTMPFDSGVSGRWKEMKSDFGVQVSQGDRLSTTLLDLIRGDEVIDSR